MGERKEKVVLKSHNEIILVILGIFAIVFLFKSASLETTSTHVDIYTVTTSR